MIQIKIHQIDLDWTLSQNWEKWDNPKLDCKDFHAKYESEIWKPLKCVCTNMENIEVHLKNIIMTKMFDVRRWNPILLNIMVQWREWITQLWEDLMMFSHLKLSTSFWAEVMHIACYLINRPPLKLLIWNIRKKCGLEKMPLSSTWES